MRINYPEKLYKRMKQEKTKATKRLACITKQKKVQGKCENILH